MFQPSAETINNVMQFRSFFSRKFNEFSMNLLNSVLGIVVLIFHAVTRVCETIELLIKDGRFERLYPK